MSTNKKVPIQLTNPEAKEIWEAVLQAKEEVAKWPAWKRGQASDNNVPADSVGQNKAPPHSKDD